MRVWRRQGEGRGRRYVHSRKQEGEFQLGNNTGLEKLSSCPEKSSREISNVEMGIKKNIYKLKHVMLSK